jgi:aminotransferase
MIEPGDEVLIATPCYVSYEPCAIMAGATVKTINLKNENNFKLTKKELEEAITPKTKVLIINYPNNPTGAIMERTDYEEIASVIVKNDIVVISDEIYNELTYNGKKPCSIAEIDGMKERTIIVNGFSKAYSMTGWRLGYAMGPKEILAQMIKIHQFCIMCAPTNSQYAGVEALKHGDDDIELMRNSYNERRRYLLSRLKNMGIDCFEPFGAFYVFPDIRKFGMTSEDFCMKLLESKKVVVVPGDAFGKSGEGFIRISYAYSIEDLKIALDRIEEFVKELTA